MKSGEIVATDGKKTYNITSALKLLARIWKTAIPFCPRYSQWFGSFKIIRLCMASPAARGPMAPP